MFVNSINPTLFSIGPLEIRFYGIVYALGLLILYWFLHKNKEEMNINEKQLDNIFILITLGMLVGARLAHFLFSGSLEFANFIKDPLEFLRIWHGGMSFFGGLALGILFPWIYIKKQRIKWLKFTDVAVLPLAFILGFGRIANYINSEFVGTITNVRWCVIYTKVDSFCRHPYQIYAAISHFVLFGILFLLYKNKSKLKIKSGTIFFSFIALYGLFRFITDFFRNDTKYLGLIVGQYTSIIVFIIGILLLKKIQSKKEKKKISLMG